MVFVADEPTTQNTSLAAKGKKPRRPSEDREGFFVCVNYAVRYFR